MIKGNQLSALFVYTSSILTVLALSTTIVTANEQGISGQETAEPMMLAENHGKEHHKGGWMKKIDTDGDGSISKDEFMAHSEKKFSKKDKNNDGVISADEMKHRKHGKCHHGKKKKQES